VRADTGTGSGPADRQNFSKFLVKDGKIKWFPARSTKVSDVEAAL
jgi:hypothetical protein